MEIDNPLESRDELLDLFVACANIAEPEHPYRDEPYPISRDDMKAGWCRSDGPYWAKCGPGNGKHIVRFDPCTKRLLEMRFEKVMAVITHELAHITEGRHTDGGNHNKAFWREMAFVAWMIREELSEIESITGVELPEEAYVSAVIHDPNRFTVDNRVETVIERRQELAELLGIEKVSILESYESESTLRNAI